MGWEYSWMQMPGHITASDTLGTGVASGCDWLLWVLGIEWTWAIWEIHVEPALQRYWMHLDYGFYFGLWLDYIVLIFCYFSVLQFCYMFYFSGKVHMYPNVLVEVRGVDFLLLPYRFLGLILGGQTWWEVPFTCWPTLPSLFVFCLMILVLNLGH